MAIDKAIDKGIEFLAEHQFHNGEFCGYIGPDEELKEWCVPDSTNFITAVICNSLVSLKDDPRVDLIIRKPIPFLKYQMMRGGLWVFFPVLHKMFTTSPPDSDTTSNISAFLKNVGDDFPDNTRLLLRNRNREGLFYTWFAPRFNLNMSITYWLILFESWKHPILSFLFWKKEECSRNDIDAGVNANVLYYLGLKEYTRPILSHLLKIIEDHNEDDCDKWYRDPFIIYYFISRNYHKGIVELEPVKKPVTERIVAAMHPDGRIGDSILDTGMAINTLIDFNHVIPELELAVNYILKTQSDNGSWARHVLYWGGPAKKRGWGSEELTTGFCLEALARCKQLQVDNADTSQATA